MATELLFLPPRCDCPRPASHHRLRQSVYQFQRRPSNPLTWFRSDSYSQAPDLFMLNRRRQIHLTNSVSFRRFRMANSKFPSKKKASHIKEIYGARRGVGACRFVELSIQEIRNLYLTHVRCYPIDGMIETFQLPCAETQYGNNRGSNAFTATVK